MASLRFVRTPATRPRLRHTLALAAAVLAPVLGPAVAKADPGVEVDFGDRTAFVPAADLAASADVVATPYVLRAAPGGDERVETPASGVSVRTLIALAGGDPDTAASVSVTRADGSAVELGTEDLSDPPPFPEGPPLFWADDAGSHFLRPLRDDEDANEADRVTIGGGAPVVVNVQAGALLDVTAGANRTKLDAGGAVRFWATAIGGASGETFTYKWHFDDGRTGRGAEVRHVYRDPGRYRAYVTVSGSERSGGTSAVITITVGEPEPAPAEEEPAAAPPPPPPASTSPTGAAGGGTGAGAAGGDGDGEGTGAATRAAERRREVAAERRRRERRRARRERERAAAEAGPTIEGTLIGEELPPAVQVAARPEARPVQPAPEDGGGAPVALVGALGAGGLVAAGALLERLPRRRLLPGGPA